MYSAMEVRKSWKGPECHLFVSDHGLTPITVVAVLRLPTLKLDFIEEAVLWCGKKKRRKVRGRHGDPLQSSITERC